MKNSILKNYIENSKKIIRSYNNPLKKKENLLLKDQLEQAFYDEEAEKFLNDFDENLFRYDENEDMPMTHRYFYSRLENIEGKHILDCCCGHGFASVKCAKRGARVTGIDISSGMIELAKKNAAFNSVADRTDFRVMSAQEMNFKDEEFDYVIGNWGFASFEFGTCGEGNIQGAKTKRKSYFY